MITDAHVQSIIDACYCNADAHIKAAETLNKEDGGANIVFHLALLALEETGKAGMIFAKHAALPIKGESFWIDKRLGDHESKIFWAIWSENIFQPNTDLLKNFHEMRDFAKSAHQTRLNGLYVNPCASNENDFLESISVEKATTFLTLAKTKLRLNKERRYTSLDQETLALYQWYIDAMSNEHLAQLVYSKKSIDKLAELDDAKDWMGWIKADIENVERELQEYTEKELARKPPEGEEIQEEKWKIRVRLRSQSHTFDQKELSKWNAGVNRLAINAVENKKSSEGILEITLPKIVPAQQVYSVGLTAAVEVLISINIATFGFFWFYLPECTSKYFEGRIKDLDAPGASLDTGISPRVVNWKIRKLTELELNQAMRYFSVIKNLDSKKKFALHSYYSALIMLANNNIFARNESLICGNFLQALTSTMKVYGDWKEDEPIETAFNRELIDILRDNEAVQECITLVDHLKNLNNIDHNIGLDQVKSAKLLCDAYLYKKFDKESRGNLQKEAVVAPK